MPHNVPQPYTAFATSVAFQMNGLRLRSDGTHPYMAFKGKFLNVIIHTAKVRGVKLTSSYIEEKATVLLAVDWARAR